jgi:hypothetical protein
MIGSHLPISIFQQLAIMQAFKVPEILGPCIYMPHLLFFKAKSKSGTGSYDKPNCISILLISIEYLV